MSRPAVFLDRDGTIIDERRIRRPAPVRCCCCRRRRAPFAPLNARGYAVVVVTNQSGIARGLIDEAVLAGMHEALDQMLAAEGAVIDGWYHCPHHPEASLAQYRLACACRKPAPGMMLQARDDLDLDLARSWMVGDRWLDVEAGVQAGARAILVRTGHGSTEALAPPADVRADAILNNLMEAVGWILRSSPSSPL